MERYFSSDVLVDILKRSPPSSRRRFLLVCRHWRHLVDTRTIEMQSRAKPLIWDPCKVVAYVVDDDLSLASTETYKNTEDSSYYFGRFQMVGTSNDLICLCNNQEPGGAITVVNPVTREKLSVPPLRCAGLFVGTHGQPEWDKAYTFGYLPITGRYKVVHVPCSLDRVCEFDTVHVLMLGEASWQEVPVVPSGTKCNVSAGVIICMDGATHWIIEGGSARIICFDLHDECVTSTRPLPASPAGRDRYHLTEVHRRLALAVWDGLVTTEVWVFEKETWSRWYSFKRQDIPRPHFAYGEYVMMRESLLFYVHRRKVMMFSWGGRTVANVGHRDKGMLVAKMRDVNYCYRTFSYVKTNL